MVRKNRAKNPWDLPSPKIYVENVEAAMGVPGKRFRTNDGRFAPHPLRNFMFGSPKKGAKTRRRK